MIELTEQQMQALKDADPPSLRFVDPRTNETYILIRLEDYERLTGSEYDDSPWTREEMQALARERVRRNEPEERWEEYNGDAEAP